MHDSRNNEIDPRDTLLDRALASYADAEPDPSLRARITARLAETAPRPRRLWLLAPLAACAAAVVIVATLVHIAPTRVPHPDQTSAEVSSRVPHPDEVRVGVLLRMPRPDEARVGVGKLKSRSLQTAQLRSLPAPASLTAEERLLLKFAAEHPDQARAVLTPPSQEPLETAPVVIAPIQIAALSVSNQPAPDQESPQH